MIELSIVVPIRGRDIRPLLLSIDSEWVEVIPVHYDTGLWNISRAVNRGIRRSGGHIVAKVDADLVLPPGFVDDVLGAGNCFCVAPVKRLREGDPLEAAQDYSVWGDLSGRYWPCGGWQSAPREFWFDIRGYDEDMILYGAEDTDMWNRAALAGLPKEIVSSVVHRWHVVQAHRYAFAHAGNVKLRESRRRQLVRNMAGWGGAAPSSRRELTKWVLTVLNTGRGKRDRKTDVRNNC